MTSAECKPTRTMRFVWMIFIFLFLAPTVIPSFVTIDKDNGGYNNVIVAISDKIKETEDDQIVPNLQNFLAEASIRLHESTRRFVHFQSISVLLPNDWTSTANNLATFETHIEADVRVEPDGDPSAGGDIKVHQPGGCGDPGRFISLTPQFLRLWNQNKDNETVVQFVRAWAKYRYGIFDEIPFRHETSNHSFYYGQQGVAVTGCSSPTPWVLNNCSWAEDIEKSCQVEKNASVVVKTSIMDDVKLRAKYFCDDGDHDAEAPTKHNALCREQNTWDVITGHKDFQQLNPPLYSSEPKLSIEVVRAKSITSVIVIDSNLCNVQYDAFDTIRKSVSKAFDDFPTGSRLGWMRADIDTANIEPVETDRSKLMNDFLGKCSIFEVNNRDILKALRGARKALEDDSKGTAGGDIILLVDGPNFQGKIISPILNEAKNKQIRYHIIVYPPMNQLQLEQSLIVETSTEVHWFQIPQNQSLSNCDVMATMRIDEGFTDIMQNRNLSFRKRKIKIYEALHESHTGNGSFLIPSQGIIYFKIVLCNNKYSIRPKIFEINGTPVTAEGLDKPYNVFITEQQNLEPGFANYNIDFYDSNEHFSVFIWFEDISSTINLEGQVTQKPFQTTNLTTGKIFPSVVILRVVLTQFNDPIVNASVSAAVTHPNGETTYLELFDSGNGDPDLGKDDGVYSRYFTNISSKIGWYSVNFEARSTGGSFLKSKPGSHLPPFDVSTRIGDFYLSNTIDQDTVFPPSRIVDFHVATQMSGESPNVTFQWTTPGNYFDTGTVKSYKLKCTTNKHELELYNNYEEISGLEPKSPGTVEHLICPLSTDELIYCAILAVNGQNKVNDRSNIVTVKNFTRATIKSTDSPEDAISSSVTNLNSSETILSITGNTVNSTQETLNTTDSGTDDGSDELSKNEVIIIGCLSGLVFIVTMFVICICIKHRCCSEPPKAPVQRRRRRSSRYNVDVLRSHHRPESFARADEDDPEFHESVRQSFERASTLGRHNRPNTEPRTEDSGCSTISYSQEDSGRRTANNESRPFREIPPYPTSPPVHYNSRFPQRVTSPPPPIPPRQAPVISPHRAPPPPPKTTRPPSEYSSHKSSTTTLYSPSEESIPYTISTSTIYSTPQSLDFRVDQSRRPSERSLSAVTGTLV